MNKLSLLKFALLEIGGSNITVSDASSTIGSLNDVLKGLGIAVGAIIILVATVKLIIGLALERPDQVSQSSLMFSVGAVFASLSIVLTTLDIENIDESTTASSMAQNVINVICAMLTFAGAIITLIAIVYLIMAIAQEQPESKVTGTKMLGTAIGLISVKALGKTINQRLSTGAVKTYMLMDMLGFIANVVTYIGAGFVAMGVWYFIESFKSEESREREISKRFLIAGVGLVSMRLIVIQLFGITPTSTF